MFRTFCSSKVIASQMPIAGRIDTVSDRIARQEAFADVAAELSDDLGSASLGGELGFTDGTAFLMKWKTQSRISVSPGKCPRLSKPMWARTFRLEERISGESVDYDT